MELFQPLLDALDPPYDIFASAPAYMFIRNKQVPLAPGMSYGEIVGPYLPPDVQPPIWEVTYDSDFAKAGHSYLSFDADFILLQSRILPEDQDEFQPLLDAFSAP
jgi:hypothetical protein